MSKLLNDLENEAEEAARFINEWEFKIGPFSYVPAHARAAVKSRKVSLDSLMKAIDHLRFQSAKQVN